MPETDERHTRALASLRDKIDAIDAEMHRLLIERGTVIDALIRTKGTERPGAAFRPGREADMMRRLVARHEGALPLATVEHIWREIITTFTRMQAPFDVAIDGSADGDRMRDLARFYFGFSVKLVTLPDAAAVVAHVATRHDLGIVARDQPAKTGPWWRGLRGASAPRVMALLPHILVKGRSADLPAFVISPQLADPTPPDLRVFAATIRGDVRKLKDVMVLTMADESDALLAAPARLNEKEIVAGAAKSGVSLEGLAEVGGIAEVISVEDAPSAYPRSIGAGA